MKYSFFLVLLVSSMSVNSLAENLPKGLNIFPEELLKLRDPFKKPAFVSDDAIPKSDLETYPIDQFQLIGVMTGPDNLRALLVAPNNKTYIVSESDKIGVKKGVIRRITPRLVKVEEKILNALGQEESIMSEIIFSKETKKQ